MLRRPVTLCEYVFFVSAALFAQRKPKSPTVPFPRLGSPTAGRGKGIVLECSRRECSQTQFIDRCNFVRSSVKVRTPTLCARLLSTSFAILKHAYGPTPSHPVFALPPQFGGCPSGYLCLVCEPTNLSTVSAVLLIFSKTTGRLRADKGTATPQPTQTRPTTNTGIAKMIAPATIKTTTIGKTGLSPKSHCLPMVPPPTSSFAPLA